MEENKSGIIHVRVPLDRVDQLDQLSVQLGLNRSRIIKFALQRFLDLLEQMSSDAEREEFIREIRSVSDKWKVPRPTRYQTKRCERIMLVAEEADNPWETAKKRGRKKSEEKNE